MVARARLTDKGNRTNGKSRAVRKPKVENRGNGKKITFSEEEKVFMAECLMDGWTVMEVAKHFGVHHSTLYERAGDVLKETKAKKNALVEKSLFWMATKGKVPVAAMFWMKSQAGWREQPQQVDMRHEYSNAKEIVITRTRDALARYDEEIMAEGSRSTH